MPIATKNAPVRYNEIQESLATLGEQQLVKRQWYAVAVGIAFAYWVARMGKSQPSTLLTVSRSRRLEHHIKERGLSWVLYAIDGAKKNPRLNQRDKQFFGLDSILPYQNPDRIEESVAMTKHAPGTAHPLLEKYPALARQP